MLISFIKEIEFSLILMSFFTLGTVHKRRLPNFSFFGVPSLPLSPHVSYGSKTPLGRRLPKPAPPSPSQFFLGYIALLTRQIEKENCFE